MKRSAIQLIVAAATLAASAAAQDDREPSLDDFRLVVPSEVSAKVIPMWPAEINRGGATAYTNNVMLTGYWPPTNEMLRQFSRDPAHNPGGWVGHNWRGLGYDVYAYFPEFPQGVGRGEGDFEVDYQDTSNDWWIITAQVRPVAIITFSRANTTNGWELEGGNRTYVSSQWTADYLTPLRPTPELPIMQLEPPLTERYSTLPIQQIITNVTNSGAAVMPFSTVIDDGRFLSNFIGYHGCWYRVLHESLGDADGCASSGHIHVGMNTNLAAAVLATEVTVETLIGHVDGLVGAQVRVGDLNCDGNVDVLDINPFIQALADPAAYAAEHPGCHIDMADINGDLAVDIIDINGFIALLESGG
ncbi:hypothetical protein RAS1_12160 [Phycisphaerae bacterium RAS1]|nr:hypothetical protein RAS1_12160 [Phycisphaerae bacterium RAS1]